MAKEYPMRGPGQFQWNTGGWFGGQLGGTLWILVGAATLVLETTGVAAWWLLCFAAANGVGLAMWRRRDRLPPYPAIQALLAVCGLAGLLAVSALHAFGPVSARRMLAWRQGNPMPEAVSGGSLVSIYALLILGVPTMMAWFAVMEWAGRRARRDRTEDAPAGLG